MCPTPLPSPDWLPLAKFAVQLGTLFGAAGVAAAALLQAGTARKRHEAQIRADRERRISESFTKAGEQLGSDKLETRLVGIYTLESISKDSKREYYWPIIETLTAYVREHTPWPPRQALANSFVQPQASSGGSEIKAESTSDEEPDTVAERTRAQIRPAADIRAILTVLGRRDAAARQQDEAHERWLDLAKTDLRGAYLLKAHLERAYLREAHLERAYLREAHLERAYLYQAHLDVAARNDVRSDARFRATSDADYLRPMQAFGARSLRLSARYVRRTRDRANLMHGG